MVNRIVVLFMCFFLGLGHVYSGGYTFDHISTADGLPNNRIRDIIQDQSGYLWFATSKGVSRYDGHLFQNYPDEFSDSLSLGGFRLRRMFEDKHGAIWSTSLSGKCYKIDPSTQNIVNLQEKKLIPKDRLVKDHYVTSLGDVWLLLDKGVVRMYYDDASSSEVKSQHFDRSSLGADQINFVHEDKDGFIWLGTDHCLTSLFFDAKEKVKYVQKNYFMAQGLSFNTVEEYDGKLYFGVSRDQVIVYDSDKESFKSVFELDDDINGYVTQIVFNNSDYLLLGMTDGKVIYFNTITEDYKIISIPNIGNAMISDLFADSYGYFWITTEKRGIYCLFPNTLEVVYFGLDFENRIFLGEQDKQLLFEDSNRDLWIGINGGGLFKYNRADNEFIQYRHQTNNSGSISSDVILSLYEDRSKNLWIGTASGGLNKVSLKKDRFDRIFPESVPKTGFDNYIRTVTTDILDNMWFGTKAGKIYVYGKNKQRIATLPDDLNITKRFPLANVYALYFDDDNNLWIGTKGYGLFVIKSVLEHINNLGNESVEVMHFSHELGKENVISSNNIYCIEQDMHGQYWIGAFKSGLDLLIDPFTDPKFQTFTVNSVGHGGSTEAEIRDLMIDLDNNLWIATSSGVSILESQYLLSDTKKFIQATPTQGTKTAISEEVVYQIKQVSNGDVLFAMMDGGIHHISYDDFTQQKYVWKPLAGELTHFSIYSIEEDTEGNIWMGADNGLFRYSSDYEMIDKLHLKNNQLLLSFSENSSCTKLSQELVFGSTNGLVVLNPDSIRRDSNQYPILFSKLEINGSDISVQNSDLLHLPISTQKSIELSCEQNNVSLFFSVLDFENPNTIQYKSFLEGYDNYWSQPTDNNSVSYRKLPPGEYTLWVKGTNSSGVWMEDSAKLDIIVTPLFRKSIIGRILLILIILIVVTSILYVIYRQFKIQNRIKVDQAITEKRIEYYTNLSHEFITPLSLILSPVEEIISSSKGAVLVQQKALQIKKNATYLKRLIEQILDFRKMREGRMKLRVSEIDVIEFFREIYLVFLPLSKKMGVHFDYEFETESCLGYADAQNIEKIAYNLLSNAFRFSSEGKSVQLVVSIDKDLQQLCFRVIDQGPGISEQEIDKIFQRFYDSEHSSGIGLFYTRELVSLHKGEISVSNNSNQGANFLVTIPLSKKAYSVAEIADKHSGFVFDLKPINDIETIVIQEDVRDDEHKHLVDYFETILVVEDNEEMRNYIRNSLSEKFKVLVAKNGEEGLALAQSKQPTLIVSDIAMPIMDGYEMVRRLKSSFDTSHIPIFLVTAESSEDQKIFAMECGADDFISKPFNLTFLLAKINHVITQRKRLKERFERDNSAEEDAVVDVNVSKSNFLTQVQELAIDNMSNENMNVEFLVEKMGYSRTLFYKKMRSFSGYAPNEYIRIVRMKEAARLLTTSDKSINEISTLVGIGDSNYFSKTFKKHFGESPSLYKSNN